eukprot:evm.model.scf_51.4 EVM.evm.TU.scf_51.4   scf_51:35985-40803(-)
MAHRILHDPDSDGWERSDFPIVCETCLGPNPYVRMQRIEYGGTCHISGRPYTVFRWRPGNDARYKKTIICQEVAKAKNVCQVCLLDLDYGLPVQVRDSALGIDKDVIPESDVNKEYKLDQLTKSGELGAEYQKASPNDLILKLQRTTPYYKRNMAPICSFFVRGLCNRGAECPYRHEMPTTGELAEQNIKDRYYGINDPVAKKMLRRAGDMPTLTPPEDDSITTLYIGGLNSDITEEDLRDKFYSYGEIESIKIIENRHCAFIAYTTRKAAETAAEEMANRLIIRGTRLKLMWGRPPQPKPQEGSEEAPSTGLPEQPSSSAPRPTMLPPQVQIQMGGAAPFQPYGPNYFNLPPRPPAERQYYPSMDPLAMGTTKAPAPGQAPKRPPEPSTSEDTSTGHNKRPRHPDGPPGPPMQPVPFGMPPPPGYQVMPAGRGMPMPVGMLPMGPTPIGGPPMPGQWPPMQGPPQGAGPRPMVQMMPPPMHPAGPPMPMGPRPPSRPPQGGTSGP